MKVVSLDKELTNFRVNRNEGGYDAGNENRFGTAKTNTKELVSILKKLNLDFVHLLALLLKADWERFSNDSSRAVDVLNVDQVETQDKASIDRSNPYRPDTCALFDCLEQAGSMVARAGYDQPAFESLCREMVLANLHLVGNSSAELAAFAHRAEKTRHCFDEGTPEEKQLFKTVKTEWMQYQEDLGEALLVLENARLEAAAIVREWMARFGATFIELQTQANRYEALQLRMELAQSDPDMTLEEMEKLVVEVDSRLRKELEKMEFQAILAQQAVPISDGETMTEEGMAAFKKESKALLRQLWMTIHPDRLCQHPAYHKLTEVQQQKLVRLWHEGMKIHPEEMGFGEHQLGAHYRSLEVLKETLNSARVILANAGIDTDVQLIIQGESLAEQTGWLQEQVVRLGRDMTLVRAELKTLLDDQDTQSKSALLASSEKKQEQVEAEMLARADRYRSEATELESALAERFSQGGL